MLGGQYGGCTPQLAAFDRIEKIGGELRKRRNDGGLVECLADFQQLYDRELTVSQFDPTRTSGPTSAEADCVSFSTRRPVAKC